LSDALLTALDSRKMLRERRGSNCDLGRFYVGKLGTRSPAREPRLMATLAGISFSKVTRGGFVRPVVAVAAFLVLAVSVSVAGAARSGDFRDEFTSFEVRQWVKIGRPFGHGTLDPANVTVADGLLGIRLPAGTLNGGEMRSTSLYRYGTYRTRMKIANAPSSLTAFFPTSAPITRRRSTSRSSTTTPVESCSRRIRGSPRRTTSSWICRST
jgi:beta-glucanase (GH16 family)